MEEKKSILLKIENGENPMNIKKLIAKNIITQYHDEAAAELADIFFSSQFQSKNIEEQVFEAASIASLSHDDHRLSLLDLCHRLKSDLSKSAVRRLIENGGVRINSIKITDPDVIIELIPQTKIKIGKRAFFELLYV